MSDFILGALVGFGVWQAINLLSSLIVYGETIEVGKTHVAQYAALLILSFVLANLIHLGIIL